jgi:hypothetical protein
VEDFLVVLLTLGPSLRPLFYLGQDGQWHAFTGPESEFYFAT